MKIQVSKTFASFINKTAKELNFKVFAKVVNLSENEYKRNVNFDIFSAYDFGDYNFEDRTVKAILLTYPENYFALPKYLSTKELNKEFERNNIKDLEGLKRLIKDLCEI